MPALTFWVILVHPNSTFFVARDDGQLLVSKEKVGGGYAALVRILRQDNEFVRIFLYTRPVQLAQDFLETRSCKKRTWKATNQTLFTASPIISRFFNERIVVT